MAFSEALRQALNETGAPPWEKKKVVPTDHQARLVITPEIRNIVKTIAERNETSICTIVWFAMFNLWKNLEYSQDEFRNLMIEPYVDLMPKKATRDECSAKT